MGQDDDSSLRFDEEERLPWLEPIEDYEADGASAGRLVGLVLAGLLGIGAVVGGLWWWQNHGGRGNAEVIAAPETPYKVEPAAEKGRFDGEGNVAVAAAQGVTPQGSVDVNRAPERPTPPAPAAGAAAPQAAGAAAQSAAAQSGAAGRAAASAPAGAAAANAAGAASASAAANAASSGSGSGMVQLGAFASEATAARAWDALKGRFSWLANVNRAIVPATVNGRTVYRLRAAAGSNSAARALCQRLRVAGENCIVP